MTDKLLLISDLDGTLLDRNKKIPLNALESIERFVNAGGLFTVATGRTEDTCRLATDILPINAPVILYNGASIMNLQSKSVLFDRAFSAADYRPLINQLLCLFPRLCIQIFAYGPLILVNPDQIMDPYILRENQPYRIMPIDKTPNRWLKIMLSASHEQLEEIRCWLDTVIDQYPPCSRFYSADYYYEILPVGCCKGACVQWLAEKYGLTCSRVAAIGDHLNDVEMLKWAGFSFAPSNAHDSVKKVASVLHASNDEGAISEAIGQLLK